MSPRPAAPPDDRDGFAEVAQTFWDVSIDMLATASADGFLTRVSPSWERVLGYPSDELLRVPYLDFVHPEDVDRTLREAAALLRPGHATVSFENRYRAHDGTFRRLAWNASTLQDGAEIYCVVRDVTEEREAAERREQLLLERDRMLSGVIENTMTLVYVKDLEGRYLLYNKPFAQAFGLDARGAAEGRLGTEVLLGRDDGWLDPALQPVWRANDRRAAAGPHFVKEWSDHPELGRLTYDSCKFPLLDADGAVYATCGVSLDTTDHARAIAQLSRTLDALRLSETRTRAILDGSNDAFVSVDASGILRDWNPRAEAMLGYRAEEATGRPLVDLVVPARHRDGVAGRLESLLHAHCLRESDAHAGLTLVRRDGREFAAEASMSRTTSAGGTELHVFLRDVSARKEVESRQQSLLDQEREQVLRLQELDRVRDEFISVVTHELRTPLTSVAGYLDLVLEDSDVLTEQHARFLEVSRRNTSRLERLVDDLLTVFRLDSNRLTLERTLVDLSAATRHALEVVRPAAERSAVEVTCAVHDDVRLVGDPVRLAQVVDNLVSNAVKYTPDGGTVGVTLSGDAGGGVTLVVTDTGIGIPAAEQGRLFERFFRSSLAQQRAIQGTGLGLVIARSIVEAHGGSLQVDSTEGQGSTFTVRLPGAAAD